MKLNWKTAAQIGATYMGAVVGAGFASGQELVQFFIAFGPKSIWGIVLSGLLFSFLGALILLLVARYGAESYQDILLLLFGRNISKLMDLWIILSLFTGLCIMIAGSGAIFSEHLGLSASTGRILTAVCIALAIFGEKEGIMWINSLLIPFLIIGIIIIGITSIFYGETSFAAEIDSELLGNSLVSSNWLFSTLLYVSYNLIIGMVILASLGEEKARGNLLGGVIGGLLLGLLSLIMGIAFLNFSDHVFYYEIPMLYLAGRAGPLFKYFYIIVLWFSMLTTAVANAYGLTKRLSTVVNIDEKIMGVLLIIIVLPFTQLGFAHLVANIYPLFGYAGLPIVVAILLKAVRLI